jgi:predicted AAA+ superfamily ATPase
VRFKPHYFYFYIDCNRIKIYYKGKDKAGEAMFSISDIGRSNEWWRTGTSPFADAYKMLREEYQSVLDNLPERRIQMIIGPRRVGKSTLMQQVIGRLLEDGTDAGRILFFSGDDPTLFSGETFIGDIIETYASDLLHEPVSALTRRVYIFIDEIHVIKGWQLWLKKYYDARYDIKFIVSGSSASHLFDSAIESLLGRTDTLRLMPLDFRQFCRFWAAYKNDGKVAEFVSRLPERGVFLNPAAYYEALSGNAFLWDGYKPYVNAALKEFLLLGGYPEYFSGGSAALWQKRLAEDMVSQGLYRDIVSVYRIKSPDKLEKLLFFIAGNNGQDFNIKTVADTVGCDNETVNAYLHYLSQAYMTVALYNFSPNTGKSLRKNKALYVLDNGVANALLRLRELDETATGHIAESVCARNALAACEDNLWSLYYWREKGAEVDLVIDRKTDIVPVEVKYTSSRKPTNLPAFWKAFGNKKIPFSLVITKDFLSRDGDVFYVPFYLSQ